MASIILLSIAAWPIFPTIRIVHLLAFISGSVYKPKTIVTLRQSIIKRHEIFLLRNHKKPLLLCLLSSIIIDIDDAQGLVSGIADIKTWLLKCTRV